MYRTILKSKIYNVSVSEVSSSCSGSIGIDKNLMREANILKFEQVHVLNVSNGKRFITYAIPEESGICIYGAATKLVEFNDRIIILSYTTVTDETGWKVKIVSGCKDEDSNPNESRQKW